jgi:hypothetical protein
LYKFLKAYKISKVGEFILQNFIQKLFFNIF